MHLIVDVPAMEEGSETKKDKLTYIRACQLIVEKKIGLTKRDWLSVVD